MGPSYRSWRITRRWLGYFGSCGAGTVLTTRAGAATRTTSTTGSVTPVLSWSSPSWLSATTLAVGGSRGGWRLGYPLPDDDREKTATVRLFAVPRHRPCGLWPAVLPRTERVGLRGRFSGPSVSTETARLSPSERGPNGVDVRCDRTDPAFHRGERHGRTTTLQRPGRAGHSPPSPDLARYGRQRLPAPPAPSPCVGLGLDPGALPGGPGAEDK